MRPEEMLGAPSTHGHDVGNLATAATSVAEHAAFVYDACVAIVVTANGGGQWDVLDDFGGQHVATVNADVLAYLDENYDLPVVLADGSPFVPEPA